MHLANKRAITSCVINVRSVRIAAKFLPYEINNIVTILAHRNGDTVASAVKNSIITASQKKSNGTWSVQITSIVDSLFVEVVSHQLIRVLHDKRPSYLEYI